MNDLNVFIRFVEYEDIVTLKFLHSVIFNIYMKKKIPDCDESSRTLRYHRINNSTTIAILFCTIYLLNIVCIF